MVPLFMINKGVFSEVDVEVKLPNEVLIATGSLRIERTPRPPLRGMGLGTGMLSLDQKRNSGGER